MAIDLKTIEKAIAQAISDLLTPLDVRVYRYPDAPKEYGEAGRISQLFVGFDSLRTTDRSSNNPLTSGQKKVERSYLIEFKIQLELFDHHDYEAALDVLNALLTLDGYGLPVPEARPLIVGEMDFEDYSEGYWIYEGSLQLAIDTSITIYRPPELIDEVQIQKVAVGIWVSPIAKKGPVPADSSFDQGRDILESE